MRDRTCPDMLLIYTRSCSDGSAITKGIPLASVALGLLWAAVVCVLFPEGFGGQKSYFASATSIQIYLAHNCIGPETR